MNYNGYSSISSNFHYMTGITKALFITVPEVKPYSKSWLMKAGGCKDGF